jgi:1-deoxy-D-xylulose-5-phosphate synthase
MNARFLKPFDEVLFKELSQSVRLVATIEDNVGTGGLFTAVSEIYNGEILKFAHKDKPLAQGTVAEQKQSAGLDAPAIAQRIEETLKKVRNNG